MRNRLLFLFLLLTTSHLSHSQLVGTDCFLQGHWLEVGIDRMGAFGTCTSPATYHPHVCCGTATAFTPGGNLDVSYDWGHDGWSVGSPALMGNYTIPGFPQEGWSLQVGATEYRNWASGAPCTGPFAIAGSNTAYSNTGGRATGIWQGAIAGISVKQETRIDTESSWIVVTTRLYNTTASPIANVWYERTCDPDNTSFWSGTSLTSNIVVHQNEDVRHMVQVVAHGNTPASGSTPAYNANNSYMSLATKDCRAKCGFLGSFGGLYPGTTPSGLWSSAGLGTALNDSNYSDVGIWLVFNIGTIAANDSAVISYAYIYRNAYKHSGIDSAFPEPALAAAGSRIDNGDTVDGCSLVGVDSVDLDILFGDDKTWTWSKWTWTPSIGLSATTGVHVKVGFGALSGYVTYTLTGTDSATGMRSCHNRQLLVTVKNCRQATVNDPCVGDALVFGMLGDSVGATYFWTGPTGFTSTLHHPVINPTTWADTGMYRVIRTVGGVPDTDFIHVLLHPLPVINATSNIPNRCDPMQNPLNLFASLDSAGETFSWSGPGGFTSVLQNPSVSPFDSSLQGTYTVTGTSIWGCRSTTSTDVIPGVKAQWLSSIHYGCEYDTVYFTNYTTNASVYQWVFGDATPDATTRHAMHVYRAGSNAKWNVLLRASNTSCVDTEAHEIDARHSIKAAFDPTPDTICFNGGANSISFDSVGSFASDSGFIYPVSGFGWSFGDGTFDNTQTNPVTHTFTTPGIFPVRLLVNDAMGCPDSITHSVWVVDIKVKSFHDTLLCVSQPLPLENKIITTPEGEWPYKFSWSQSPVANLDNDTVQIPHLFGVGVFTDVLTVTIPGIVPDGCPVTNTMVINSVLGKKLQQLSVSQTIDYGSSIQLNASNEVIYYWLPNDGSLDNNNINNPIASPKRTTTYTVFGLDDNGCRDSAYITIYVDTTMDQDVPTAFTPNGDGVNDVFKPVGIKFQHMVEFRVFNRWGQEVFYTNNKEIGWDGTFHGTKQDLGTYNYLIIVNKPGQDNVVYKGNVTLLR